MIYRLCHAGGAFGGPTRQEGTEAVTVRTGDVAEDMGREEEEARWGEVDTDLVFGDLRDQRGEEGSHATLTHCLCDLGRIASPV